MLSWVSPFNPLFFGMDLNSLSKKWKFLGALWGAKRHDGPIPGLWGAMAGLAPWAQSYQDGDVATSPPRPHSTSPRPHFIGPVGRGLLTLFDNVFSF